MAKFYDDDNYVEDAEFEFNYDVDGSMRRRHNGEIKREQKREKKRHTMDLKRARRMKNSMYEDD